MMDRFTFVGDEDQCIEGSGANDVVTDARCDNNITVSNWDSFMERYFIV